MHSKAGIPATIPGLRLRTYGLPVLAVTLTTLARLALCPASGGAASLVLYPFAIPLSELLISRNL